MAQKLGLDNHKGVLIEEVLPDTPAAAAGFHAGDVLTSYAGQAVSNPRQLQEIVERSPAGSTQQVEITRDNKPLTLSVVVKPLPEDVGGVSQRAEPCARTKGSARL